MNKHPSLNKNLTDIIGYKMFHYLEDNLYREDADYYELLEIGLALISKEYFNHYKKIEILLYQYTAKAQICYVIGYCYFFEKSIRIEQAHIRNYLDVHSRAGVYPEFPIMEEAKIYIESAIDLLHKYSEWVLIAQIYMLILHDYDKALEYFNKAKDDPLMCEQYDVILMRDNLLSFLNTEKST